MRPPRRLRARYTDRQDDRGRAPVRVTFAGLLVATALAGCSSAGTTAAPAPPGASRTAAASAPVVASVTPPVVASVTAPDVRPTPSTASPSRPSAPSPRPRSAPTAVRRALPPAATVGEYTFPIRGCTASYGRSHHDYAATDIFAARGCAVVAPVTGRVDEVNAVDRWTSTSNAGAARGGLSFSIVGVDGVRYYGSHLSRLDVHVGQQVRSGQVIGAVGNSGDARGIATHVHFGTSWPTRAGVWWVRRGEVAPWPYLDNWRAGGNHSPAGAVAAAHRRSGDVPPCRIDC